MCGDDGPRGAKQGSVGVDIVVVIAVVDYAGVIAVTRSTIRFVGPVWP